MLKWPQNFKIIVGLGIVLALSLCNLECTSLLAQSNTQDSGMFDGEQILVLKNGEMLIGRIEQDAANLIVHVRQGSRLVISKKKAEFVCDSKSEAFWGKAARIRASDSQQQVALFRWCLKHKLFEHAETQLNIIMNSDISATELVSLNRQLTVLRDSEARQKKRLLAAALETKQLSEPPLASDVGPLQPLPRLSESMRSAPITDRVHTGGIQQASFTAAIKPSSREVESTVDSSPSQSNRRNGLSKVGAIPDLKRSHLLGTVAPVVVDPYDASRFNAETARRKSKKDKN